MDTPKKCAPYKRFSPVTSSGFLGIVAVIFLVIILVLLAVIVLQT